MAQLVIIGKGRRTHYRADGTGMVPAGRSRCEVTKDGDYQPYYSLNDRLESPVYEAPPGQPSCHWCANGILRDRSASD
jgi:hypothetical protein